MAMMKQRTMAAAAQTASLNDQDMMTYMPGEENTANMDDEQFNASLDALLENDEPDETNLNCSPPCMEPLHTRTSSIVGTSMMSPPPPTPPVDLNTNMNSSALPQPVVAYAQTAKPLLPAPIVSTTVANDQTRQAMQVSMPFAGSSHTPLLPNPGAPGIQIMPPRVLFFPGQMQPIMSMPPPVTSSPAASVSTTSQGGSKTTKSKGKRSIVDTMTVSEDESERAKRRQDRNSREQQRSHKITEKIIALRQVLTAGNVHFKPDKYSTLVGAVSYIKQLQARASLLEKEHKKLIDTIRETGEMVHSGTMLQAEEATVVTDASGCKTSCSEGPSLDDDFKVFVRDLDYKAVFNQCAAALAVASIDGRFIAVNKQFVELTGLKQEDFVQDEAGAKHAKNLSLFNLLSRSDMEQVFLRMRNMLKTHHVTPNSKSLSSGDFWSGSVRQNRNSKLPLRLNISLVRSSQGRPKFFNCTLHPDVRR